MKILIPTDFSSCAKEATEYAVEFALKNNAEIILLNVYEMKISNSGFFIDFEDSMKSISLNNLKEEVVRIHDKFKASINLSINIEQGTGSLTQIINEFDSNRFDLVVMGTKKGISGIDEVLLGSETARVIGETNIPVFVIPRGINFEKIDNILFALDLGEEVSREEVSIIGGFCAEEKRIHLFHSYDDVFGIDIEQEHQLKKKFMNYFPGSIIYLDLKFNKDKLNAIEEIVKDVKPGAVVVRSKHMKMLQSLFHKSVTEHLSIHINKPLLVLK
jgi:nucleotide-binding universal stress UspA family protein